MKNAVTSAEQQIDLFCKLLSTKLAPYFSTGSLYVIASNTFLHGLQRATLVLLIHLAHGCKFAIAIALSHNVQNNLAIVRVSDLRIGDMKGAAIIFAVVVPCLHHDTAIVC